MAQQLDDALAAFAPAEIDAVNRAAGELQSVLENYFRAAASGMQAS